MLVEEQQQRRAIAAVAPLSEEKERPSEERVDILGCSPTQ